MNSDEKKVVAIMGAYVTVFVAPFAVSYIKIRHDERKKRKQIDQETEAKLKRMWFAAGKVTERFERGDYNKVKYEDMLLDLELEVIKAENEKE